MSALNEIAARIQSAWESGAICSLVGRGCRARVHRLARLVDEGTMPMATALLLAEATQATAFGTMPLPVPGHCRRADGGSSL